MRVDFDLGYVFLGCHFFRATTATEYLFEKDFDRLDWRTGWFGTKSNHVPSKFSDLDSYMSEEPSISCTVISEQMGDHYTTKKYYSASI